jgi:nitrogen-specific signal transduction histidine kinase
MLHAIYIAGKSPIPDMDITPMAFLPVSSAMLVSFFRYNLLNMLPIARTEVFAGLHVPVLVLDGSDHLLALNPAAEKLLGIQGGKSFGRHIDRLLVQHPAALSSIRNNMPEEIPVEIAGRRLHFAIRFSPFSHRRGKNIGRIIIFQDVTEHNRAVEAMYEAERLEGILEMAGAVCHDLSQPAMAACGYAELLLTSIPEDSPLQSPLTRLVEQVEALGNINKKLLSITQRKPAKQVK